MCMHASARIAIVVRVLSQNYLVMLYIYCDGIMRVIWGGAVATL